MKSQRFLLVLVFVVGAASLGTEIAAARLMAPYFGASTIVWANTIGVVLVALSVGYWLGGRLADRRPELKTLCSIVMGAAVLLAIVPFLAQPFLSVSVDALDEISAGAFVGSLLGVLVLVSVPVVLLGSAAPFALRLAMTDVENAGTVAGRLYAVSTAGSLFGTMISALVTIPFAGTQRTFLIFAVGLGLVAAAGLGRRYAIAPVILLAAIALPASVSKATRNGDTVLYEGQTETQFVRVIQEADGDRRLELNEGIAQHSFLRPGSYLTGFYWDGLLAAPFAALDRKPRRIAILGNAAGTAARNFGHFFPRNHTDGVEIDGKLTELGRRYFDMHAPSLSTYTADARPWLRQSDGDYDVIVVDAYRQPYIPFYLATREFFDLVKEKLAPGGVVVVNVGHPEQNDDLERSLGRTLADVFPTVLRDPIEDANTMLIASEAPGSPAELRRNRRLLPDILHNQAVIDSNRMAARLPGGKVFTDDKAPVEWLIDRSIIGYANGE